MRLRRTGARLGAARKEVPRTSNGGVVFRTVGSLRYIDIYIYVNT